MAIITRPTPVSGLSVWVEIEDEVATEYEYHGSHHFRDETQDLPTSCCYIKAQTGKTYMVSFRLAPTLKIPSQDNCIVFQVDIDGTRHISAVIRTEELKKSEMDRLGQIVPYISDDGQMKLPVFSDLRIVEEADHETVENDTKRLENMGRIDVFVMTGIARQVEDTAPPTREDADTSMDIAMKAMIKGGHRVSHGSSRKVVPTIPKEALRYSVTRSTDLGVFRFYYGSKDVQGEQFVDKAGEEFRHVDVITDECAQNATSASSAERVVIDLTGEE